MDLLKVLATFFLSLIGLLPNRAEVANVPPEQPSSHPTNNAQKSSATSTTAPEVRGDNLTQKTEIETPPPTNEPTPEQEKNNETGEPQEEQQNLGSFKYPNSETSRSNSAETKYQTGDDPEEVTNWYKNKIKEQNLNVRSFVQTTVNNKTENLLVGANGNQEIRIEITRDVDENLTTIVVKAN